MFKVALALSIMLTAVFPLGQYLLQPLISTRALQSMPSGFFGSTGLVLFFIFAKYFLVALILYMLFLFVKLDHKFDLKGKGSTKLLVANILVVAYSIFLILARMVPGGGFGYLVQQLAILVLFPCWMIIIVGLIQLWKTKGQGLTYNKAPE